MSTQIRNNYGQNEKWRVSKARPDGNNAPVHRLEPSPEGVCRNMGVADATFFRCKNRCKNRCKKKYRGLEVLELRRLRQLEENRQLKRMVADLCLDRESLRMRCQEGSEAGPAGTCAFSFQVA